MPRPPEIVYYSGPSGMTARFVEKLAEAGFEPAARAVRLPMKRDEPFPSLIGGAAYILITPTHGAAGGKGSVPRRVIEFLNTPEHRAPVVGVVGSGNTNFGQYFVAGAIIVAKKLNIPLLGTFELAGTPEELTTIKNTLEQHAT